MARYRHGAIAVFLLLAACGSGVEAGVNVKSVATDLVYGVPEEKIAAAPANIGRKPDEPVKVVFGGSTLEDIKRRGGPAQPPAPECPKADIDEFPDPAMSSVQGRPKAGQYMWRVDGTEETALIGRIKLPRSTRREILGVRTTDDPNFEFTTVERDLRFGSRTTIKTTYEVRDDDGIYLIRIERETEGGRRATFDPVPQIEVLPLPVELGAEVNSTGVDPNSLEVLRVTGTVPKRFRIDACGDPVDSFLVDATQEFISSSGESTQRNYDYGVATQFGGMIVFEHVDAPCASQDEKGKCDPEPTLTFDAHLGQIEPDPV